MTGSARTPPLARAILAGDRRALAQTITAIENGDTRVSATLRALYPHAGSAPVIGLTGPLGVGKSSLLSVLIGLLRERGKTVGVVAIDPSSPYTGGSVLGDRIRLERKANDDGVFFRSMASRGEAGGVAASTREVARLLAAAGYDVIFVETVGSGQVDVAIRGIATTSVVVLVPHLGDEVQTLKAGLFEIADVFCVNKADLPGADLAARDLSELVALGAARDGWAPVIVATSTTRPAGIEELWRAIEAHEQFLDQTGLRVAHERARLSAEITDRVKDRVGHEVAERLDHDVELRRLLDRVVARKIDPAGAAEELFRTRYATR
ncbi:MAG: methylmalonyl Co-A mutase-associated GTPase MeaB [Thermoplasmata archaeon]|jgi:LAO/AO transport system kinase|nr:methylmalonyl Co-A mutase-associated GTPase MeaB [Thermoplasmata archaeon]